MYRTSSSFVFVSNTSFKNIKKTF